MKQIKIITLLTFAGMLFTLSLAAQGISSSDLTGRWTLLKIEETEMQADAVLKVSEYTPESYTGAIPFRELACFADAKATYEGGESDKQAGNIQLYGDGDKVYFHTERASYDFSIRWQKQNSAFVLEKKVLLDQGANTTRLVKYTYANVSKF